MFDQLGPKSFAGLGVLPRVVLAWSPRLRAWHKKRRDLRTGALLAHRSCPEPYFQDGPTLPCGWGRPGQPYGEHGVDLDLCHGPERRT